MATYIAVDIGASSGRVMLADVGPDRLEMHEAHRFGNDPVEVTVGEGQRLHWDVLRLFHEVLAGLAAAASLSRRLGLPVPGSIGIDTWAVDYGLLDASGALVGNPVHYRDSRNQAGANRVAGVASAEFLYSINGLQQLPFTTVNQLAAEPAARLAGAAHLLLIPDLLGFWLTGVMRTERTNASTTGLLDARTGEWSAEVLARVEPVTGPIARLLSPLCSPGDVIGAVLPRIVEQTGLKPSTVVVAVGSHDTASAVAAVPALDAHAAYISCGTWALVGVEVTAPVLSAESRAVNFTNERGVDGGVRYLRNVMGLWLLQESLRRWRWEDERVDEAGADLVQLLAEAAELPAGGPAIDVAQDAFLPPGDMPSRIRLACERAGLVAPVERAGTVRCILDSLAAAFSLAIADASRLSGHTVATVHIVGGGSANELLCQLTSDACGLAVVAGPSEATALGNALVQARADGVIGSGSEPMRHLVAATVPLRRYEPVSPGSRR